MAVQRLKEQEKRPAGLSKGNGYYLIRSKKLWNFSIITAELSALIHKYDDVFLSGHYPV